jgi:LysR family transcriptional regulator (chromosome initiation inhibitor)
MNGFDPAALDCLAALADEQAFDRAAQRLFITQSAVSQRLRTLESQVGQPLVVRSRPLRLTEAGKVLLRFARQLQALRVDVARELGQRVAPQSRLAIAVNADSLATWVLPALDSLVQQGLSEGYGLELVVDDQDFTHDSLREGAVLGCVTTVAEALQGCRVQALGVMRYVAVASPGFMAAQLPEGLHASNFADTPFLVFNRKDDSQSQWVSQAFGVRMPRLRERFVPSSEAYVLAAVMGWGVGVAPEIQVRPLVDAGKLIVLKPDVGVDVALYWHQWQLGGRSTLLDRIGQALADGARRVLVTDSPAQTRHPPGRPRPEPPAPTTD